MLLVEDDPETLRLVCRALEAFKRVEFVVESVVSSEGLRDELARQALKDELTGLYSKSYFAEVLKNETCRVQRYERDLSCMMLDLDDFALIGEAHGHQTADAALKQIAASVRGSIREGDVAARYGQDEFCVLLAETPANLAGQVAERVRFEIAAQPLVVEGRPLYITASVGVCAASRQHHLQPDEILDRAAAALREAKATGKNRVCVYSPPSDAAQEEPGQRPVDLGQQPEVEST